LIVVVIAPSLAGGQLLESLLGLKRADLPHRRGLDQPPGLGPLLDAETHRRLLEGDAFVVGRSVGGRSSVVAGGRLGQGRSDASGADLARGWLEGVGSIGGRDGRDVVGANVPLIGSQIVSGRETFTDSVQSANSSIDRRLGVRPSVLPTSFKEPLARSVAGLAG
jgi:hypothetical protein